MGKTNVERLAELIVEIIQMNYEKIIAAHESDDWEVLKDYVFDTLQNVD